MANAYLNKPKSRLSAAKIEVQEEFVNAYLDWLRDESYLDKYKFYEPFGSDVLVRVFRFEPEENTTGLVADFEGTPLGKKIYARTLPVARVIKVGSQCTLDIEPGDLVTIPDKIAMTVRNPAYDVWMEEAENSRPKPKGSAPPQYIDALVQWSDKIFIADKVQGMQHDDMFTFLLPQGYLRAKINPDSAIQSIEDESNKDREV